MAYYTLGNALRGEFGGEFETDDEAWDALSDLFNRRFPSRNGRSIQLTKTIRTGKTAGGNETEADRLERERAEVALAQRESKETDFEG
jgi:hypothetical protein